VGAPARDSTPPTARDGATAIYDDTGDRMILFGGYASRYTNEVWTLELSDPPVWRQLAAADSAPPGVAGHSAVYDPVRRRMIVFGAMRGDS